MLLGELEPMVRVGMTRVLVDAGAEVLPEDGAAAIVARPAG